MLRFNFFIFFLFFFTFLVLSSFLLRPLIPPIVNHFPSFSQIFLAFYFFLAFHSSASFIDLALLLLSLRFEIFFSLSILILNTIFRPLLSLSLSCLFYFDLLFFLSSPFPLHHRLTI